MKKDTSWGGVAGWYDKLLSEEGTYQKEVIAPNLLRLMEIKKGEMILDLACGTGFFANEFMKKGAKVIGADISKELVEIAKEKTRGAEFVVAPADNISFLKDGSVEKAAIVLSIQNIENMKGAFEECGRILKPGGKLYIVMNHPAFRIPKESSWGWDNEKGVQYRRIDSYLSESKEEIVMNPGGDSPVRTVSFHRPLQLYFKALHKAGFCVDRFEEWNSNRKSELGPRARMEDNARKEFPLFLCIEAMRRA